jgi:hypothetical protein
LRASTHRSDAPEGQARQPSCHYCGQNRNCPISRRLARREIGHLGVDPDLFSQSLDKGIKIARSAGADVVLINAQYSQRTESMIALGTYVEDMRWVALQQEVPLFDRFSIMKLWGELGTFDLYSATKKLDIAERVHDCIGRLLADMVVSAAKPEEPPTNGSR